MTVANKNKLIDMIAEYDAEYMKLKEHIEHIEYRYEREKNEDRKQEELNHLTMLEESLTACERLLNCLEDSVLMLDEYLNSLYECNHDECLF